MSSKDHVDRLSKALIKTRLCEVVTSSHTHEQVRVLLRIAPGSESVWTELINRVLEAAEYIEGHAHHYQAHVCKQYFRKELADGTKKLVFGWYISVQSGSMSESLDVVARAIHGSLPTAPAMKRKEVEEMPLSTKARELNAPNENGRGAHVVGGKGSFKPFR